MKKLLALVIIFAIFGGIFYALKSQLIPNTIFVDYPDSITDRAGATRTDTGLGSVTDTPSRTPTETITDTIESITDRVGSIFS